MGELLFAARHLVVVGFLALVAYALGRAVLFRIEFRSAGEQAGFCASLGLE